MSRGMLESQALVVPAGGWACHVVDASATFDATVAAGTYSPQTLLVALEAAIEAGSAVAYSASIAISEGGTGQVSITASSATEISWTSTDLRDVLGYTGTIANPTSGDTFVSTYGVKGLYLPDAPYLSPYGSADPGHTEGGPTQTVSPLGVTKTLVRPTRVKMPSIRWSHISAARARQAAETGVGFVTPASFERFLRETMFGAVSYFRPGGAWRFYWNADSLGTYTDYNPVAPRTTAMDAADPQWRGLYAVEFGGFAV